MHLLLAQKGTISDGNEAIDLGQSPADIVFLSAADTEVAAVAAAQSAREGRRRLRVASLMQLLHPMSIDTYVERTARHAKLIVVRALGGASYFAYALETLHAAAVNGGGQIAVLPGDDKPDGGLEAFCTVGGDDRAALWRYLIEGGAANTEAFLDYCAALIDGGEKPGQAVPLLKAGIWERQGAGRPASSEGGEAGAPFDLPETERRSSSLFGKHDLVDPRLAPVGSCSSGTVAVCFYRALLQSGQLRPVEALCRAIEAEGLRALPVFVSSLKDPLSVDTLRSIFAGMPPDVVVNATGFSVSAPGSERRPTVLDETGAPVLQAIFSGSSAEAWKGSAQGLSARDLAMNVALPEVDGRVLTRAVSFKAAASFDEAVEANVVSHEPMADRATFVARLAAAWVRLGRTEPGARRVALVLANYPNRDGRLGNGVGLDTPAATVEVLKAMAQEGYPVADLPADGDRLIKGLMAGPTNAASDAREVRETLPLSRYKDFLAKLPIRIQEEVTARWGAPENDPFVAGDRFRLPLQRFGGTLVGIQPARGYNIDPKDSYHSPDLVPPHGYFAFYAFLREVYGAHAVVHMGKHGNLEWLPGKALALSAECYPEAVFGPLPQLYPFIVNDPGEGTQAKRRSSAVIIDHLTPPLTRAESYGPLKDLEALVDEYYEAAGSDPRRLKLLRRQILDLVRDTGLDHDAGIGQTDAEDAALEKLDAYLCDLKEMQIRDGLHVFGRAPEGAPPDRSRRGARPRAARIGAGRGEPAAGDRGGYGSGCARRVRSARLRDGGRLAGAEARNAGGPRQ